MTANDLPTRIGAAAATALVAIGCGRSPSEVEIRTDAQAGAASIEHAEEITREALVDLSRALPPTSAPAGPERAAEGALTEPRGAIRGRAQELDLGLAEPQEKAAGAAEPGSKAKAAPTYGDVPTGPRGSRVPLSATEAEQRRREREGAVRDGPPPARPVAVDPHGKEMPEAAKPTAPAEQAPE